MVKEAENALVVALKGNWGAESGGQAEGAEEVFTGAKAKEMKLNLEAGNFFMMQLTWP